MLDLVIGIIIGGILYSIVFDGSYKVRSLEVDLRYAEKKINHYRAMMIKKQNEYDSLLIEYNELVDEYNILVRRSKNNNNNNGPNFNEAIFKSELIKKAIKKAMMDSHPDRGGNSTDFIAYKEMYDKVKGA